MEVRLSVQNVAAIEFTETALDTLATEKFKDIYAEIAHTGFHMENLESPQTPLFYSLAVCFPYKTD